ncbi:invasion associated locus B family protein [Rhodovibrionaceae bacterium A322]
MTNRAFLSSFANFPGSGRSALSLVAAVTAGLLLTSAQEASAQAIKKLGDFKAWSAYTTQENGKQVCFMASVPTKAEGNYTRRGDIFAMVTLRPKDGRNDEVSFIAGYTHKSDSEVKATVDGTQFTLFTKNDTSWLPTASKQDATMIATMKKGARMQVIGYSSRGTKTTDTYSLGGFTAAHKAMRKACGK